MSGSKTVRSDQAAKKTMLVTIMVIKYIRSENKTPPNPKDFKVHGLKNGEIFIQSTSVTAFFYSHFLQRLVEIAFIMQFLL